MATTAIHPGEHLAEELDALNMSAAELARQLQVPTNRITSILNGQRAISGDTALRLAHFFGTSPQFWAESSEPLRNSVGRKEERKEHQETAVTETRRRGARVGGSSIPGHGSRLIIPAR